MNVHLCLLLIYIIYLRKVYINNKIFRQKPILYTMSVCNDQKLKYQRYYDNYHYYYHHHHLNSKIIDHDCLLSLLLSLSSSWWSFVTFLFSIVQQNRSSKENMTRTETKRKKQWKEKEKEKKKFFFSMFDFALSCSFMHVHVYDDLVYEANIGKLFFLYCVFAIIVV